MTPLSMSKEPKSKILKQVSMWRLICGGLNFSILTKNGYSTLSEFELFFDNEQKDDYAF